MKVRRTQRDKRGARYAVLISAAVAHLLHFYVYRRYMSWTIRTYIHTVHSGWCAVGVS